MMEQEIQIKKQPEETEVLRTLDYPNFETDLPTYFPLHLSLRINSDFTQIHVSKQIDGKLQSARKVTEKFIDYVSVNPHLLQDANTTQFFLMQTESYKELLRSKYLLEHYQKIFNAAKHTFVEGRRSEANLNLENYQFYRGVEKENFADGIISQLDNLFLVEDFENYLKTNMLYQYLKHVGFILENPEDPLPDDSKDDELAVSGGKISLKDPISMEYFTEPVQSLKCLHVFEKKYIYQQLGHRPQIHCPITGCDALVTSRDLKDDKLMALRVKVSQARVKTREQRVRI
ncbi:Zinc-finger-containing protein [Metschnikowia aff. pulcherrima]|uniref:Zinc-finger-containing protein n=1 Tax=Metschnikowia aff. pulcherrima TaxID=2163413 RepID=A0A4P6XDC9_9ASCO|nr:Zinc-finger-containing protein [Metschnikowia aff. pulcherrima]